MGRCPISSNASVLDCNKDVDTYHSNGCCISSDCLVEESYANVDYDDCKATVRCSFEKILSVFLKEIGRRGIVRPLPALLGEGGSLDLFELFMVVREKGGYRVVSENQLWSSVVVELGLDLQLSASVKLIYSKYLGELEKWLMLRNGGTKLENGNSDYHYAKLENGNSGYHYEISFPFLSELEAKIKGMVYGLLRQKNLYHDCSGLKSNKQNGSVDVAATAVEEEIKSPKIKKKEHSIHGDVVKKKKTCKETLRDDDEKDRINVIEDDRNCDAVSVNVENEIDSLGKYRESLLRMLKWARKSAKNPADTSNGIIPGSSKWKGYDSTNAFWLQVIRAKDALLIRKDVDKNAEKRLLIQKKVKMHPSIYEDNFDNHHLSNERIRCGKRCIGSAESALVKCSSLCPAVQNKLLGSSTTEIVKKLDNQTLLNGDLSSETLDNQPNEDSGEKSVPVGTLFQAVIPEWTGNISDSDSKWVGMQSWPSQHRNSHSINNKNPIGRGRPDSCRCQFPSSVECFRFHIAEARMRLKLELGLTFYDWRFHHMGEEISLQWTSEEEKRFKELSASSFNNQGKCFWNYSLRCFPKKSKKNLISYYFNVFLLRQRSYQNRVTPNSIDSDDEDVEFGCVSGGFGEKAMEILGTKSLECSENRQCTDFGVVE